MRKDAELVVSEVVSNALLHGRALITVPLAVVASLAVGWGIRAQHPGPGKTVWAHLRDATGPR